MRDRLRDGLSLTEMREMVFQAKLKALKEAADKGWADIEAGRYIDISDENLDDFLEQLGERARQRVRTRE